MVKRTLIVSTCVAGLLLTTALPASAQFADFFCDTFTIGCRPPPPPPPPPEPAPVEAPKPVKKVKHKPKPKKAVSAAEPADTTAVPATPAPKAQ